MPGAITKPDDLPNIIRLNSDELPDIRNWKPGTKYRIVLEVQQMNMSIGGDSLYSPSAPGDKNKVSASFRVLNAKPQYGGGGKPQAQAKPAKSATMDALARKATQS